MIVARDSGSTGSGAARPTSAGAWTSGPTAAGSECAQFTAGGQHGDAAWQGSHIFFPFFPLLFLLLIAAVVITGAVRPRRWWAQGPGRDAESKLGELYAAGDIDENEFRTRRAVLREKKEPGRHGDATAP